MQAADRIADQAADQAADQTADQAAEQAVDRCDAIDAIGAIDATRREATDNSGGAERRQRGGARPPAREARPLGIVSLID